MLFYYPGDFESKQVKQKFGFAWFWWFGGAMGKTDQSSPTSSFLQLCKFRNFTNGKARHLKGDPHDFNQKTRL
jgi:hypothetical protein